MSDERVRERATELANETRDIMESARLVQESRPVDPWAERLASAEAERDALRVELKQRVLHAQRLADRLGEQVNLRAESAPLSDELRERLISLFDLMGQYPADWAGRISRKSWDEIQRDLRAPRAEGGEPCPKLGSPGHNIAANPCHECEGTGWICYPKPTSQPTPSGLSVADRVARLEQGLNHLADAYCAHLRVTVEHCDVEVEHWSGPLGDIARELAEEAAK